MNCNNETHKVEIVKDAVTLAIAAMDLMTPIERNSFFEEVKHQWLIRLPKADDVASKFLEAEEEAQASERLKLGSG